MRADDSVVVGAKERAGMRGQILAAATQLFGDRGYAATSLQSIANAVGIRKASLLYHFPAKELLRDEVVSQLLAHWQEELPRLLLAGTSGKRRFEAVVGEVVRFFNEDPARARLLMREALDRPEHMRRVLTQFFSPLLGLVSDYIRRGQSEGIIFEHLDPEAYVLQVFQLVVASIGVSDVLVGVLTTAEREAPRGRHTQELVRIAQASLFRVRPTDNTGERHG